MGKKRSSTTARVSARQEGGRQTPDRCLIKIPERKTSRRWGMYNSQKSAKLHLSPQDFEAWKAERGAPAGAETEPSFGLMPTCPAAIVNDGMRAFLAPDRSGEVSPAASAE